MGLQKNLENGRLHFNIYLTSPITAKLCLVNFLEKMIGTWFYLATNFFGQNHGATNFRL